LYYQLQAEIEWHYIFKERVNILLIPVILVCMDNREIGRQQNKQLQGDDELRDDVHYSRAWWRKLLVAKRSMGQCCEKKNVFDIKREREREDRVSLLILV
jgi:hypothetical protein